MNNKTKFIIIMAIISAITVITGLGAVFARDEILDLFSDSPVEEEVSSDINSLPPAAAVWSKAPLPCDKDVNAVWLACGVDYGTGENPTAEQTASQIEACFENIDKLKFINALYVDLQQGGRVIFKPEDVYSGLTFSDNDSFDVLDCICQNAEQRSIPVYFVISPLETADASSNDPVFLDPFSGKDVSAVCGEMYALCRDYSAKGIILRDLEYLGGCGSYSDYEAVGGGTGYDNYRADCLNRLFKELEQSIHKADDELPVGLLIGNDAYSVGENGLVLNETNADCVASPLVDFVLAEDFRKTGEGADSFDSALNGWDKYMSAVGKPYFIAHSAKLAVLSDGGWNAPDQIISQIMALADFENSGSVFNSLSDLLKNESQLADLMSKYFNGTLDTRYMSNTLSFTTPQEAIFTTYDSEITFRGTSDPNYPLTLDGEEIPRGENGSFAVDRVLSPGKNTFTFVNKRKTVTFQIDAKIVLLKNISPANDLTLESGTTITLSTVSPADANVSARIGGSYVELSPSSVGVYDDDETTGGGGSTDFYGTFTLPQVSEYTRIGTVVFTATYGDASESAYGGTIYATAPMNSSNIGPVDIVDWGSSEPVNDEVMAQVMAYANSIPKLDGTVAEVVIEQAETFTGNTLDDWSRPTNNYFPMGTLDFTVGSVLYYDDNSYVRLACGRRTYLNDYRPYANVKTYQGSLYSANAVGADSYSVNSRYSSLTFDTLWKAPFFVNLDPQSYLNDTTRSEPDYTVSAFTATHIDITFKYCRYFIGTIDIPEDDPLFSSAQLLKSGEDYGIRLNFKRAGAFYGYSAYYNTNGQLEFDFLHDNSNSDPSDLSGIIIVLDPGHGADDPGAPGAYVGHDEKDLNLVLARAIRNKLTAMGATVYMLRDSDADLGYAYNRTSMTRRLHPDLFISVHHNSGPSSAYGYEDYYFNPYSYTFANNVYSNVLSKYQNVIYADSSRRNGCGRGCNYYPFFVTRISDCPAILSEYGFVSNSVEYEILMRDSTIEALAQGTADGVAATLGAR